MIKYKKYQVKSPKALGYGKWYGRAVRELMEFDDFIEHMAKHHCVFSEGTIRGVLIEMEMCLRELLLEGKAVRLDDLGIFAIGLHTDGKDKSEDFTTQDIKGVSLNLYLGKRFRARQLLADAKFKEADKYAGDGNWVDPENGENAASDDNSGESPANGDSATGNDNTDSGANNGGGSGPGSSGSMN